MTDQTQTAPAAPARGFKALELDTRLLGMIGAFILICLVFNFMTDGRFLTPRNIFNLTIQTVSVAIMATGMVFVIVTRHIDLSVGSLLATCSAIMAMLQTNWLPDLAGIAIDHPMMPWLALGAGLVAGAVIGAFHGWLIGYQGIPAFIVTLGGFMIWRNVAWHLSGGQTVGPLNETYMLFGGIRGTLGAPATWVVAILASAITAGLLLLSRRNKQKHGFPVKPAWAEYTVIGVAVAVIMGFCAILSAYEVPDRVVARDWEKLGCASAEVCDPSYGLPYSVFLLILVALVMSVVASRTRLGRYIFATGGNPDAAALSGINTRLLTVKIFTIMGILCATAAFVASARQFNHTNDIGTLDELRVIAAAVIGGTALSGGIGTIYGAILGALIMQSLASGMAMAGVDTPYQNIVVGFVLVLAVWLDIQYRKYTGAK